MQLTGLLWVIIFGRGGMWKMRILSGLFVVLLLVIGNCFPVLADSVSVATPDTVYVTNSGTKYHLATCEHAKQSGQATLLANVQSTHSPCRTCLSGTEKLPPPAKVSALKSSDRCTAITKKGTQCMRKAKSGSAYCWQHRK